MKKLDMYHLFGMDVLYTAYSEVDVAPRNSREHFEYVNRIGYPSLKGDVRITSDGRVVMCHDGGFTFDENGRILSKYDRQNPSFLIAERTLSEFLQQTHAPYPCQVTLDAAKENEKEEIDLNWIAKYRDCSVDDLATLAPTYDVTPGSLCTDAHLMSLEEFVDFCKANHKICYLTLRRDHVPEVVAETIRVLREKDMMGQSLLNSFNIDTLEEIRKHDSDIPISNVRSKLEILSRETVDQVADLGNSLVTMFSFLSHPFTPTDGPTAGWKAFNESKDAREYAATKNVPIHMAQIKWQSAKALVEQGVTGFHVWDKEYCPPKMN